MQQAKALAVATSSPVRILQSYFADECHFAAQPSNPGGAFGSFGGSGFEGDDDTFAATAEEARLKRALKAGGGAGGGGGAAATAAAAAATEAGRLVLTAAPSAPDVFVAECLTPRTNDFDIPTTFEVRRAWLACAGRVARRQQSRKRRPLAPTSLRPPFCTRSQDDRYARQPDP